MVQKANANKPAQRPGPKKPTPQSRAETIDPAIEELRGSRRHDRRGGVQDGRARRSGPEQVVSRPARRFDPVVRAAPMAAMLLAAASLSLALTAHTIAAPVDRMQQPQDAPAVRAIGVLRSANRRQSRAILRVDGGAPRDYAEGDAVARQWRLERIESDSVTLSDGARRIRIGVEGGDAHPALRPATGSANVDASSGVLAAPQPQPQPQPLPQPQPQLQPQPQASASKRILEDAARRRAIHDRRSD